MIALETLTGMDTRLSVEEIFNRMCYLLLCRYYTFSICHFYLAPSEALVAVDTHLAMQHKLKMN